MGRAIGSWRARKPTYVYRGYTDIASGTGTTDVTIPTVGSLTRAVEKICGGSVPNAASSGQWFALYLTTPTNLRIIGTGGSGSWTSRRIGWEIEYGPGIKGVQRGQTSDSAGAGERTVDATISDIGDITKYQLHHNGSYMVSDADWHSRCYLLNGTTVRTLHQHTTNTSTIAWVLAPTKVNRKTGRRRTVYRGTTANVHGGVGAVATDVTVPTMGLTTGAIVRFLGTTSGNTVHNGGTVKIKDATTITVTTDSAGASTVNASWEIEYGWDDESVVHGLATVAYGGGAAVTSDVTVASVGDYMKTNVMCHPVEANIYWGTAAAYFTSATNLRLYVGGSAAGNVTVNYSYVLRKV